MPSDLWEKYVLLKGTFEEAMALPRLNNRHKYILREYKEIYDYDPEPVLVHDLIGCFAPRESETNPISVEWQEEAGIWNKTNSGKPSDPWVEGFYVFKQMLQRGIFKLVQKNV